MLGFDKLPKREQLYLLESFGMSERETRLLILKYVEEFDYARIAAEMNLSPSSVGRTLSRARKHAVDIAKHLYPIADDRLKTLIDTLGWLDLENPVISNRRKN